MHAPPLGESPFGWSVARLVRRLARAPDGWCWR